jgi:hypothetical protein
MSGGDLRARIAATGRSNREVARITGLNARTINRYLTGEIAIPRWLDCAMRAIEIQQAIVALLAETKPSAMAPRQKLVAIVERFVPPPPKPPAPAPAKAPKPVKKPRRKVWKAKCYDPAVRYAKPIEPKHPIGGIITRIV